MCERGLRGLMIDFKYYFDNDLLKSDLFIKVILSPSLSLTIYPKRSPPAIENTQISI